MKMSEAHIFNIYVHYYSYFSLLRGGFTCNIDAKRCIKPCSVLSACVCYCCIKKKPNKLQYVLHDVLDPCLLTDRLSVP